MIPDENLPWISSQKMKVATDSHHQNDIKKIEK